MKPQDLEIEHLQTGGGLIQGWGKVRGKPFQFHAKHGTWQFAIFEDASVEPWDVDVPDENCPGMYIIQRQAGAEVMVREKAEALIARCASAYLAMIGRRLPDWPDDE